MKNIFGRIGLRRFIGFNSWFRQRERAVGGSGLEKDRRNDWALPMNDEQEGWIFHLYGNC